MKRFLGIITALALCLSLLPGTAGAADYMPGDGGTLYSQPDHQHDWLYRSRADENDKLSRIIYKECHVCHLEEDWGTITRPADLSVPYGQTGGRELRLTFSPENFSAELQDANASIDWYKLNLSSGESLRLTDIMKFLPSYTLPDNIAAGKYMYTATVDTKDSTANFPIFVTVTPAPLTVTGAGAQSRTYDGTSSVEITGVTLDGIVGNDDVSVDTNGLTGTLNGSNVGEYTSLTLPAMTLTGAAAGNYTLVQPTGAVPANVTIGKAEALPTKIGDLAVTNKQAHTYTYGLGALLPVLQEGMSLGSTAVTYELGTVSLGGYYTGGAEIEGQTLTLPIQAVDTEEVHEIGTVTVIIHTQNFEDMTATIKVRSVNKTIPTGEPTLSGTTLTYGQVLSTITLSGGMQDNGTPVPGKFEWSSPGNRPAAQESYAAAWTFTPTDNVKYAIVTGTASIQVLPAPITDAVVVLDHTAFKYDGQLHSPGIVSVTLNGTALTEGVDYTAEIPAGTEAGTYPVTLTGTGNYTGTATAMFTINPVEQKPLDQKDDDGNDLRLEVETGLSTVPDALKNDDRYDSPAKIETALRTKVAEVMSDVGEQIAVFDVTLQYKDSNGAWHNVDPNNFPADGVTAVLPYPAGTGATGYDFTVQHLISSGAEAGTMESLAYELTANGLRCKFSSLSPVAIGYQATADLQPVPGGGFHWDVGNSPSPSPEPKPEEKPEEKPEAETPCDGGAACPSRSFPDLGSAGTWYHEAVDYVLQNGLMGGYGNGTFGPDDPLSRAQFAQILFNKEDRPVVNYLLQYGDVAEGAWYTEAIRWAASRGIIGGYGNGMFGPNDSITREQLAVMLWRYAGSPAATGKELHFTDADRASVYALEALRWAVENGVMSGKGGGILDPQGLATRAQVAQMVKNFMENREIDT